MVVGILKKKWVGLWRLERELRYNLIIKAWTNLNVKLQTTKSIIFHLGLIQII